MLNKANFLVAEFASKEESRYTMQAILVTPKETVATNGHYLCWVSNAKMEPSAFPVVEGFDGGQVNFPSFLLNAEEAKRIAKSLPKKTTIPVLGFAAVHVKEVQSTDTTTNETKGTGKAESVQICVTDLEHPQVSRPHIPEGKFPNYEAVIPKLEDVKFEITVDAEYLKDVAKAFQAFVNPTHCSSKNGNGAQYPVTLRFYDKDKSIRFDGSNYEQGMTVVLMPMRSEKSDLVGTHGYEERQAKREAEQAAKDQEKANEELKEAESAT